MLPGRGGAGAVPSRSRGRQSPCWRRAPCCRRARPTRSGSSPEKGREGRKWGRDQTWRLLKLRDSLKRCDCDGGCEFSKFELIEEIRDGSARESHSYLTALVERKVAESALFSRALQIHFPEKRKKISAQPLQRANMTWRCWRVTTKRTPQTKQLRWWFLPSTRSPLRRKDLHMTSASALRGWRLPEI